MKQSITILLLATLVAWSGGASAQHCKLLQTSKNSHPNQYFYYNTTGRCDSVAYFDSDDEARGLMRLTYNDAGKCTQKDRFDAANQLLWHEEMTYDAQGNCSKLTRTEAGRVVNSTQMKYDKKNHLLSETTDKVTKKGKRKRELIEYEWIGDNVSTQRVYEIDEELKDLRETISFEYDAKPNIWRGVSDGQKGLSANNAVSKKVVDRFNLVDKDKSFANTLEYNAQGFATSIRRNFLSGKSNLWTFSFDCN